VSRALGDAAAQRIGVISEPDVCTIQLQNSHRFIVLASDGMWDAISLQEVADLCSKSQSAVDCSANLLKASLKGLQEKQIDDNVCNVVVPIKNGIFEAK
jgi:serine/threonine protein phosphatase PrpC